MIEWLTGFDESELKRHIADGTTFEQFFAEARMNPNASLITGVICGVRVEEIEDPLMQKIRYLDKVVDELAKGKAMEKIQSHPGRGQKGLLTGIFSTRPDARKPATINASRAFSVTVTPTGFEPVLPP